MDPTTSTLNVRWEPAEGNVREYIVIWVPTTGGEQEVVRAASCCEMLGLSTLQIFSMWRETSVIEGYTRLQSRNR